MGEEVVTLTGTISDTEDQLSSLTILWSANPTVGLFGNTSSASTTWTAPAGTTMAQTVILTLSVTDTGNLTTTAMVTITIAASVPTAPIVSVSASMTTVDGGTVVTISGTATDPNMEMLTYLWTATPNIGTFANIAVLDTTWTAPPIDEADQSISLTLTVTNTSMLSGMASISITVSGMPVIGRPGTPGPPTIVSVGNRRIDTSWIFPDDGGSAITSSSIRYRVAVLTGARLVTWYPFSGLSKANDAVGNNDLLRTSAPGLITYNSEVDTSYPVQSGAHAVNSLWRTRPFANINSQSFDTRYLVRTTYNLATSAFSIAMRIRFANVSGSKRMMVFGDTNNYSLYIINNSLGMRLATTGDILPTSLTVNANQWYTWVITFDSSRPTASRVRVYLNNSRTNISTSVSSIPTYDNTSFFRGFDGDIADIAIWSDALTDSEVAAYHYDEIDGIALAGLGVLR